MALRDLLRKLGLTSGDEVQPGVRRARLPQRPADAPTIRVPLHPAGGPEAPLVVPPSAPPPPPRAPAAGPAAPPAPAAAPPPPRAPRLTTPSGSELGGATQYFQVPQALELVAVLVGISGPLKGQVYTVGDGDSRLGREGCQITLPSKRISRYHAKIVHVEGAFVIEANPEVSARNPTLLNDAPIDAEALSDGDVLRLGDCAFKFRTI